MSQVLFARRNAVKLSYESAIATNRLRWLEKDDSATSEYIYQNQKDDAVSIQNMFLDKKCRVISVQKKTKVGADGLMIEIAKLLTTHEDDEFVVNPENVRIITGMSNSGWESSMIDKAPDCFKKKIFHNGQLNKSDILNIKDALIIIDEIDSGDKPDQRLHTILKDAGILDVTHMVENNNRFVIISATIMKELYDLYKWGPLHHSFSMTIPASYIGHKELLEKGLIKEFYSLKTTENAEKWCQEDILDNYRDDYRIHLVRLNAKNLDVVEKACKEKGIEFKNHTSTDRIPLEEFNNLFKHPIDKHVVLGIKGLLRRANLIPNSFKLRIGATHEYYTKVVDNSVQVQGFPGRMTGYWREDIELGHKTGPHRTSIKAIQEYERCYLNPYGKNSYQTAGFKKKMGKVKSQSTMLSPENILNLEPVELPSEFERGHAMFKTQKENEDYAKTVGAKRVATYKKNDNGFKMCSTSCLKVQTLDDILKLTTSSNEGSNMDKSLSELKLNEYAYRRYVCYQDITDKNTEFFVTIWVKRIRNN